MRKRTTTRQLQQAITDKLLHIEKVEIYYQSTRQTDVISADVFQESLDFLGETIFADAIGWHFERNHETGNYEIDCGRMNPNTDSVIIAHLCACDDVNRESIDKALSVIED